MPTVSVLLTGATGYIGGLLLPRLVAGGRRVRCLVRRPERERFGAGVEVVQGDCLDESSLHAAMAGIDVAYYLVHSMASPGRFEDLDRQAALTFGAAAAAAGVKRIIYLGGLGEEGDALSQHLRSRRETGDALRESGVPVVEFRCSIVIGAGSLSFEMVRALVERLPVMVCPKWVSVKAQPIAVDDVLEYLEDAADAGGHANVVCEIGGPDVVSYGDIMREYAKQRGLTRRLIPVPLLTPRLSSLWLRLVTPLYARVGRALIEGMRNRTVVTNPREALRFAVEPRGLARAVADAIAQRGTRVEAGLERIGTPYAADVLAELRSAGCLLDSRERVVRAPAEDAFAPVAAIGGETGWYYGNCLWRLRAWLDRMVGGIGMRRGRRDPAVCSVGDAVDFWRVAAVEPNRRLTLRAEMKVPGRAWLQFDVQPIPGSANVRLRQTALFDPRGLFGLLYWAAMLPAHAVIFRGMVRRIAAEGERHGELKVRPPRPWRVYSR